ncbi:hypothetical protein P886_2862 [Alteromonadaceae bacterium 2753L.S.0a.02]|nr:hypothetical protein P886_2862 [Alteromonadaceae bacterium 2753L.S.0a.02]
MWNDANMLPKAAMNKLETPLQNQIIAPLSDYRLVLISGPEAEKFLQGQCTCDFRRLAQGDWLRGAHCNAKGRMHSSFIAAKLGDETIALRMHASVVDSAMTAMKKYIVFSKAEASVAEALLIGVAAGEAPDLPNLPEPGKCTSDGGTHVLRLNDYSSELWIMDETSAAIIGHLPGTWASSSCWHEWMIRQGIAEVTQASYEQLLPQELNYQLIDGVSFDKGCYTGQEIVARMHYLGKLKKHLYLAETQLNDGANCEFGTEVEVQGKAVGKVIDAHIQEDGSSTMLVLANDSALEETVTIRHPSQPILRWQPLPYAIHNE